MTKAQREEQIEGLEMCLRVDINIGCDAKGCNKSDHTDNDCDAAHEFYKKGWRISKDGYARCPKHAPKPTTKKKKK